MKLDGLDITGATAGVFTLIVFVAAAFKKILTLFSSEDVKVIENTSVKNVIGILTQTIKDMDSKQKILLNNLEESRNEMAHLRDKISSLEIKLNKLRVDNERLTDLLRMYMHDEKWDGVHDRRQSKPNISR